MIIDYAKRLGSSLSVSSKTPILAQFLEEGVKPGYKFFQVCKYKELLKCCFKCCSQNHFQHACLVDTPKCAHCTGEHIATKDKPCIAPHPLDVLTAIKITNFTA